MFVTPTYFSKFLSSFLLNFISYCIRVNSSSVLVAKVQLKVLQVVVGNEVVHVAPGARFFLTGIVFVTTVTCVICMGLVYGSWCTTLSELETSSLLAKEFVSGRSGGRASASVIVSAITDIHSLVPERIHTRIYRSGIQKSYHKNI